MDEIRLVATDGVTAVVVRADPLTPRNEVARALRRVFATTDTPVVDNIPLTGIAGFGSAGIAEGSTVTWVSAESLPSGTGFELVCVAGPDTGRRWPIVDSELFIGRDSDCAIALSDQSVSRRHTRLSVQQAGVVVEDLGSTNGTVQNEQLLEAPQWLQAGDRIRVGNTLLEFTAAAQVVVPGLPDTSRAPYRLCVTGGEQAGMSFPLHGTSLAVGSNAASGVQAVVADLSLAPAHFTISIAGGQAFIEDLGSGAPTTLDGWQVSKRMVVPETAVIAAGSHLFAVRPAPVSDAVLGQVQSGRHRYDRIARIRSYPPTPTITVPVEPTPQEKAPFPWAIVIAPLLISLAMAYFFRRPEALLFSLLTPVMAISTNMTARRSTKDRTERDAKAYELARAEMYEAGHRAAVTQNTVRWRIAPDACEVADIASGPGARLWERRLTDDDTLTVRVGTGRIPADVKLNGRSDMALPEIPHAPITVDLQAAGVTALAGQSERVRATARWIVGQLITLVSPADLELAVLTESGTESEWGWLGWTPHARLGASNGVRVGNDRQTIETRVASLTARLDERQEQREERRAIEFAPLTLTIIENAREFRRVPGVLRLLEEGPSVGMLFLTLDSDPNRTPGEAGALFVIDRLNVAAGRLEAKGDQPQDGVVVEGVSAAWLLNIARSIAAIEPASDDAAAQIPSMVRFADLAEIDVEADAPLFTSWSAGARTCRAIVGATGEGPFSVDIAQDGPHAFIAGTTGSGKTELLLTFITALALGNRPEALNVIVVDWKGGGDFVELGGLPHTVGMVTNLDGHLAKRALASLQAEVARRQTVLKELKEANQITESNIRSLWDDQPELGREYAMGRLLIVVDEFAELAQSLPEFLSGLVRIARVGRALGIHLVLATQRPRGVISGDLSANVGLRLVLRTEAGESREVLESDHADHISRRTRGRGFVRYGDPPRLVEFQTARVAGRRPGAVVGLQPPIVDLISWPDLGYALPTPPQASDRPDAESTDLRALVDMTRRVADSLAIAPPPSPWLDPLPEHVSLRDLDAPSGELSAAFGLLDEPALQRQRPFTFDLAVHGHLAVVGSAGSGRTTALRSLAASLATNVSTADCNIYGFDFGSGGLLPLAELPHVGAIVRSNEADRVARVLDRLSDEISNRQTVLAKAQAANINDQRALDPENALPHIMVLLDRWDSFISLYPLDTKAHQTVMRLARDGLGVGIHLVVSGDRYLLGGRMGGEFERKLMLPFADRDDYRDGNLRPQDLPEVIAPGRGFLADSGSEVQIAAIGLDDSGPVLRENLRAIAQAAAVQNDGRGTEGLIKVEALPTEIDFATAWAQVGADHISSPVSGLIGVGGDDLSPELVDLVDIGPGFTIAGPPGSGRTTALFALARSALACGATVLSISPRRSVIDTIESDAIIRLELDQLDADDLAARCAAQPTLIVMDDVHLLSAEHGTLVRGVVDQFRAGAPVGFAVAGDIDKLSLNPVAMAARRSGSGLLLSPRNLDRDLLSLSDLPGTIVGRQPPGRGFLARRSKGREIQVVS